MYEARSDQQILESLAQRLRNERLRHNLTQGEVADRSGLALKTVQNLEIGKNTSLESLLRYLRVLQLTQELDRLVPDLGPSPVQMAALQGKIRQRASGLRLQEKPDEKGSWQW